MHRGLQPGGIFAWILVGLIAGALAGRIYRGKGYGCLGDIVVGLVGAFIGGFIVTPFLTGPVGFLGSIVVAVIGALALLYLLRLLHAGR